MEFDVVIAGGGPNGLMLACELALAGVRPLVLERRTGPSEEQRANGMVGQVVRLFERRGLYQRLTGTPAAPVPAPRFMFAAFPLPLYELENNPVYTVLVPQRKIEAVLGERAAELGVTVRGGAELAGFTQNDDRVIVEISGSEPIETQFLVGADGGKSTVRKLAGIDFPGVTTDESVSRVAHVRIPEQWKTPDGLNVPGYGFIPAFLHHRTERGLVAYAPFPDGRVMLSATTTSNPPAGPSFLSGPSFPGRPPFPSDGPFTIDELAEVLGYVLGTDGPVGPLAPPGGDGPHLLRRNAGSNTRIAERYRDGRVLLLGDAAHVHGAIGGPGLNLGIQDAANLGWKLAATVQGWAPAGLLDTYEAERRPAAERVTMHTQAQSVLTGPGPAVTALRTLFGELLEEPSVLRHIAELIAGADFRYEPVTAPASPTLSSLVGRFAPDLALGGATHTGRPLLVDATGTLAGTAEPWSGRVDLVTAPLPGATAMLIRPDCYVAWASEAEAPNRDELRVALTHWFGK